MFDPLLLLISLFFMGLGLLASYRLKSKFAAYSKRNLLNGLSGKQVAEKMEQVRQDSDRLIAERESYLQAMKERQT